MGQFYVAAGESWAESHALWLAVCVYEVDLCVVFADTALRQLVLANTCFSLICKQRMVAGFGAKLVQTFIMLDLAFKLIFDFICWLWWIKRASRTLLWDFGLFLGWAAGRDLVLYLWMNWLCANWNLNDHRDRKICWIDCRGGHGIARDAWGGKALDFGWIQGFLISSFNFGVHNCIHCWRVRVIGEDRRFTGLDDGDWLGQGGGVTFHNSLKLRLSFFRSGLNGVSPCGFAWILELLAWVHKSCELCSLCQSTGCVS